MDFTIGSRKFQSKDSGARLGSPENKESLFYASMDLSTGAMTAINQARSISTGIQCVANSKIIKLVSVFFYISFFDASAGTNVLITKGTLQARSLANNPNGFDVYLPVVSTMPLNIKMVLDDSNQALFTMSVNANDVFVDSGITPALTDTISYKLTISYIAN